MNALDLLGAAREALRIFGPRAHIDFELMGHANRIGGPWRLFRDGPTGTVIAELESTVVVRFQAVDLARHVERGLS